MISKKKFMIDWGLIPCMSLIVLLIWDSQMAKLPDILAYLKIASIS